MILCKDFLSLNVKGCPSGKKTAKSRKPYPNASIRLTGKTTKQSNTMTNHTIDIHTSTIQDIDNYVNTLTDTITQMIDERVQSKTLKPNSVCLPQAIRDLVKEKCRQ